MRRSQSSGLSSLRENRPVAGSTSRQAMNRLRFQSCCLREALRCPPGGSAEQTLHLLGSEDQEDRVHQGGLAHAGAAGDDGDPAGQNGLQRLPLARGQCLSGLLLTPGDGLLEVDRSGRSRRQRPAA